MLARWGTRIRNYGLCVIYVAKRQRNEEEDDKEGTRGGGKRRTHRAAGSPSPRKLLEESRPQVHLGIALSGSPGLRDAGRKSRKAVGPS